MDEQTNEQTLPPQANNRLKFYKVLTLTFVFIVVFFALGFVGVEQTSTSEFCSSCHEMKPEFYTWKASTHSEVDCVQCHIGSSAEDYAKAKGNGLVEVYKKYTNTYTAPIQMPKDIPDSACEKCHDLRKRQTTPSGDLIIPHVKHLDQGVKCIQCHSGVAHGKISQRNVTFKSDYEKWNETLGKFMMKDRKFANPKMETCMECHEAREVSTACKTCHTTEMIPDSHKITEFKTETHGQEAKKDTTNCNSCHKYMSDTEIKEIKTVPASEQFLSNGEINENTISAGNYAKENTFCKKCHTQRPPSHVKGFVNQHGPIAKQSLEKCLTCHDKQKTGFNQITNITCNTCHPADHGEGDYRLRHPIELSANQKPNDSCYTCHNKAKCTKCHVQK